MWGSRLWRGRGRLSNYGVIPATEALTRLQEGNRRFVASRFAGSAPPSPERRAALRSEQEPFAIVLGCSDARVPAELVFDQGFGDLFVIRVAGNIVSPSQIGSVEFAATRFGTRLVVVLGHSQCGAVLATIEDALGHPTTRSQNLRFIVERIRPAVATVLHGTHQRDQESLMRDAVRANVRTSVEQLRRGSPLLEELIRKDGLLIVGAEYSLESGVVTLL